MKAIGKALLGGLVLVVVIVGLIVAGDSLELSQGVTGGVIAVLIVAGVVGYGWLSQARIQRRYHRLLHELLARHRIAYVCGFEGVGSQKGLLSSDDEQLALWQVRDDQLVPLTTLPRGTVQVTRDRVQAAVAKKYDGICVSWGAQPDERARFVLYADSFWGLVFPIRGADLDEAVRRLNGGLNGRSRC